MAIDLYKNRCSVYEGEKPYIFVSYSHQDIEKVVTLIRRLSLLGFRIWYDSGIPAGSDWDEVIATHLKESKCVLSLLSSSSVRSKHFKREFKYADYLEKDILAVYLEECEPSPGLEMQVVSKQCIKCEHCENDDDLLQEIAKAQIILPCLGEAPNADASSMIPEQSTPRTEIDQLREKAEQGSIDAQQQLGYAYLNGNAVEQDLAESTKWFRRAAEQGHAPSQFCLAFAYVKGWGVEESMEAANFWYQKAADQGEPASQNNLGWSYETGSGIGKDLEKAVQLYRLSAEQGNGYACSNLARLYENGIHVGQSWEEAARWHRRAAELGMAFNQWKMADCCRRGLGVPIDEAEAARWQKLYDENPNK